MSEFNQLKNHHPYSLPSRNLGILWRSRKRERERGTETSPCLDERENHRWWPNENNREIGELRKQEPASPAHPRIRAFAGRRARSRARLIYESGPASSSSYLFVCGLVVTPRAAGPRATYNDIFVSEMSRGHFLLIFTRTVVRGSLDADG